MMGRSRRNKICILQDEMVSRIHAKITYKEGKYYYQDLGSINGTSINTVHPSATPNHALCPPRLCRTLVKSVAESYLRSQDVVDAHIDIRLRINDEVEMGNSTFRVEVHNPLEVETQTQEVLATPSSLLSADPHTFKTFLISPFQSCLANFFWR